MPFLAVPLKKTTEVDLSEPVKRWISSAYSTADRPEDPQSIQDFQKLRNSAVCRPLDRHESSLENLYRYYDQLVSVESKLPFSPNQVPVYFKWKDAFGRGSLFSKSSATMASGGFEKACVLFNVAAMQSQVASVQPLDNDNELKSAAKLLQQSAGIFGHLKDNVMGWVGQESTADLMPDTLACLSALMLAQAQEAIYLKAARDKMKPGTVAKIANQCADLYADAHKQMNRDLLRGLWEKDWMSVVSSKQSGFQGLAHYYQSLVSKEEKEIGPELAHLERAQALLSGSAGQHFATEVTAVQHAYTSAKKDNDFIYHERVPDAKSLVAIGKAALAKPLPIGGHMSQGFKDMFAHLVPVAVQQALGAYETRRTAIQNQETSRMREATQLMNGILASLNLPAAVEDACNAEPVPSSVREKAAAVRAAGGADAIQRSLNELPSLLQRNKEILEETNRLLREEQQSDTQLREQFKERWTRMPSDKLTEPLWVEIGKYKGILDTATNADQVVRQKFDEHRRGIELLSKSEGELRAAIPGLAGGGGDASAIPSVQKLKSLLQEVEGIKAQRQNLEEELKEPNNFDMNTVFVRALAESGALREEELSTAKLNELFAPVRENVTASLKQQERVMQEIQATNMEFVQTKGGSGGARQQFLTQLAAAHDAFDELQAHLQEGTKFYNDLTPLLVRLQQKVSDFCFARKTEKEDLMRDLQQTIVASPNPPPPAHPSTEPSRPPRRSDPPGRPPPPQVASAPMNNAAPPNGSATNAPYGQAPYPPYQPQGQPQPMPYSNPYAAQGYQQATQAQQSQPGYGGGWNQQQYPATYPGPQGYSYPQYPNPNMPPPMPAGYNPYASYQYQQQPGGAPPYPQQQWGPR